MFTGKNTSQGKDCVFKPFGFPKIIFMVSLYSNHSNATFFSMSRVLRIWIKVKRHQCDHTDCDHEEEET